MTSVSREPSPISYRPITRAHMRIKVPYFTSFRFPPSSIVGLGLGLVVGLGTVLVLFFIAFFAFPMLLKDRKLQPGQVPPPWHSATVFVLCLLSHGSNPLRAIIFYVFTVFFQIRVRVSFSLHVCFRVTVNFNNCDSVSQSMCHARTLA